MDAENLANIDNPAPPLEDAFGFNFTAKQLALAKEISAKLQVHITWAERGIYFSHAFEEELLLSEATAWVLDHHPRFIQEEEPDMMDTVGGDGNMDDAEFKMVLVINNELQMSAGKMAVQACHGAVDLYACICEDPKSLTYIDQWKATGSKKVVVKCKDTGQLFDLKDKSQSAGLKYVIISDAGLTEIVAGSVTCLAVFGASKDVNSITGSLQLL